MRFPDEVTDDVVLRLRRIEGQVRGIQRMLAEGQECEAIVTQLAAAKGALDRVSFRLMAAGMRHCVTEEAGLNEATDEGADSDSEAETRPMGVAELEKLFLKLS